MFPGLPVLNPLTDPAFDDPVGKEKAEYVGKEKEALERGFYHLSAPPSQTSPDTWPSPPSASP